MSFSGGGQDRLRQGFALQQQGRLAEAEALYAQVLASQPRHVQALHLLGVLKLQTGQAGQGVELLQQAVAALPSHPQLHGSLAQGLEALGRREDAVASYDKMLALKPADAAAHFNRGVILQALGRLADALASQDAALKYNPGLKPVYLHRGTLLTALGRHDEALAAYDAALARWPATAGPEPFDAPLMQIYVDQAKLLSRLGRDDEALESYVSMLARWPQDAASYNNRSNLLRALDRQDEALADLDRAVALDPALAFAHNNRGLALHALGRFDDALASYDTSLALAPAAVETSFNKSHTLLLTQRWDEGWQRHEQRKRLDPPFGLWPCAQPEWRGEELSGKTIFLHWEQGLGDTIQFCRYAPLLQQRGARVVLAVQDKLLRLIRPPMPQVEVVGQQVTPDRFDYHAALLSLPLLLGDTDRTIPAAVPYLAAEPERVARWAQVLGSGGLRIGINWQGSRSAILDLGRSFALAELQGIAAVPGVRLISLQKGDGADQLAGLPAGMAVETLGAAFDEGPDAFLDTAAVMQTLDLIITSDTSVAHLAGALGRPTWLVLKAVPDWRWLLHRADSPWYPGMVLFRQARRGDWQSAFGPMAARLRTMAATGSL